MLDASAPPYEHSEAVTMSDMLNDSTSAAALQQKCCNKCGEARPCTAFSKSKNTRDGLQTHCKQCNAQYYRENADKVRESHARYRSENPDKEREYQARHYRENADKVRESHARYYRENPDKVREGHARYYRENADKMRAAVLRYRSENPDKARAKGQRRRARKNNLPSQWTDTDIQRMLVYWGNCCAVCNQHVEPNNAFYYLAQDHWIAIADPRPDNPGTVPWNMLPLCHSKIGNTAGCNNSKHDADPIAWLHSCYPDDPRLVAKILARIAKYFKTVTDGAL